MSDMNLYLSQGEFERVFKTHIKTSVYSMSVKTLFGDRMTRKINYHPYYQRNYVWDNSKASFFIESILLGTEIPPLIFFNTGTGIEVIDGRQRYETLKNFRNGDLKLSVKGLSKLTQLQNHTFSRLDRDIQGLLDDAKIRIFEFEIVNEPRLDAGLEDKIKKEIFRRYNSGITPLNSAEIDNATYDDDEITNTLKSVIIEDSKLSNSIGEKFLTHSRNGVDNSKVLQFLRKNLVLSSFPINSYATGSNRTEIMDLLYGVRCNNTEDPAELCEFLKSSLVLTLKLIDNLKIDSKLVNETLLWGIIVLSEDGVDVSKILNDENIETINTYLSKNIDDFSQENSHYYKSIITRHRSIGNLLQSLFDYDFSLFIRDEDFRANLREVKQSEMEAKLKLDELSSLRVQKPDASLIPIEEIVSELNTNKYLIRPSYQRQEKINVYKSSAIIESIILGINLPPLFIFKNQDGVKEVVDGQQRLLSILAFLGKSYTDQYGNSEYPNKVNFKLKDLKILKEYNGYSYDSLDFSIQDKILDFKLSVVEIDSSLNVNFDPVDLFIRLNNKPYPIKDNSFEMWNSYIDKEIIQSLKDLTNTNIDWFFIQRRNTRTSDRMLNEELITLLSYINYNTKYRKSYTSIGFYLRDKKVNCRITDKKDVSSLMEKISTDVELKARFMGSIDEIAKSINSLKEKLDPDNRKESFDMLLNKDSATGKRYLVNFYMLFQVVQRLSVERLASISFEELQSKMYIINEEIKSPSKLREGDSQQSYFENLLDELGS